MQDRIAYRRRLPHFQQTGRQYLITFVTHKRWVLPDSARDLVLREVVAHHKQLFWLYTAVVMPDHVHVVLEPAIDRRGITLSLAKILKQIKGASSRAINATLQRSEPVWQNESHDHEIRQTESLRQKCEYIAQNPVRAGLVTTADEYRWLWRYWVDDVEVTG